jgi:hypothetical protein
MVEREMGHTQMSGGKNSDFIEHAFFLATTKKIRCPCVKMSKHEVF